jgi:pimeloyl-ACP methyl ester carboxylesterase
VCLRRACFAVVALLATAYAQALKSGPQVLTFYSAIDDSDQPYAIYLPRNFDPARRYPLVVSLHGAYSNHRLNLRRVFGRGNEPGEGDVEASRYFPPLGEVDDIVASPFARGTMGYQGIPEKDVYDMLADVEKRFPVDQGRVYLTGLSMGGGGALWLALTRPDLWAAVAPVCPAVMPGTNDLIPNAIGLPIHVYQGADDPVVNPQLTRDRVERLRAAGARVEYTEYPHVRHNSWDYAYRNGAIFDWFAQFRRDPFPARVHFVSSRYEYDRAYWVQLDELTPGTLASIDARFTAGNRIEVATASLGAFTLRLAGHPMFEPRHVVHVVVDGKRFAVRPHPEISFSRRDGIWIATRYVPSTLAKRPGAEGPLAAALAGPQIYVYGTLDHPSPAELQSRREIAARAADYSSLEYHVQLAPRVARDSDISPDDIAASNLILFGTKETNSLIARFSGELPMALNAGAADYGLLYIFPEGSHYVVIDSGLPWWTGIEYVHRDVYPYAPLRYALMLTFPDYLLFRGSLEHTLVEGRFDRTWHLPEADAAKMSASGAVAVER